MSGRAITVERLGKQYRLGQIEPYGSLRETIARGIARGMRRQRVSVERDRFWALQDVSLSIDEGEVVGIVGRNGAGKSTLLKILSRITAPTTGRARIHGRVGSLLEVGTGFHPELSGRENVYLNGAMLGMTRREIRRKFDEIVAFAEVDRFLDTPVKRYSSGMYVRLAFSVAAHLEPEVLLVDEVLAVGDIAFQRKCLGRMSGVAQAGRTVLFVSHNLAAVRQLCPRSVFLDYGRIVEDGDTHRVLQRYVDSDPTRHGGGLITRDMVNGHTEMVEFISVSLVGDELSPLPGQPITLDVRFRALRDLRDVRLSAGAAPLVGDRLFTVSHTDAGSEPEDLREGEYVATVRLPGVLRGGIYHVGVGADRDGPGNWWTWVPNALRLEVQDDSSSHNLGPFRVSAEWTLERLSG